MWYRKHDTQLVRGDGISLLYGMVFYVPTTLRRVKRSISYLLCREIGSDGFQNSLKQLVVRVGRNIYRNMNRIASDIFFSQHLGHLS